MDDDILEKLNRVGDNVSSIGEKITSKNNTLLELNAYCNMLSVTVDTINTYIRIQESRNLYNSKTKT